MTNKVTYLELTAGGGQEAPAAMTAITHDAAGEHEWSSGPWKHEPDNSDDEAKGDKPWLTGWQCFWLCALCLTAFVSIIAGWHYLEGLMMLEVGVSHE